MDQHESQSHVWDHAEHAAVDHSSQGTADSDTLSLHSMLYMQQLNFVVACPIL